MTAGASIRMRPSTNQMNQTNIYRVLFRIDPCMKKIRRAGDPEKEPDFIVTKDWNGPNSGVVLLKNSDFSKWLLKEWWAHDEFVHGHYPFHYEQVPRVF